MRNDRITDLLENKKFKLYLLLVLLIGALLYLYFYLTNIENAPDSIRYSGYTLPTLSELLLSIPFFPSGLLTPFLSNPDNDYAPVAGLLLGPFLWAIYWYLGARYISLQKSESYKFLGIFVFILILNVAGCTYNP
jgi:Na+/proline symporter